MRGIAKLLFGDNADSLADLFGGSDADGFGLADRARRAGSGAGAPRATARPPEPAARPGRAACVTR